MEPHLQASHLRADEGGSVQLVQLISSIPQQVKPDELFNISN